MARLIDIAGVCVYVLSKRRQLYYILNCIALYCSLLLKNSYHKYAACLLLSSDGLLLLLLHDTSSSIPLFQITAIGTEQRVVVVQEEIR